MSLSRILNDDPIPIHLTRSAYTSPNDLTPLHTPPVEASPSPSRRRSSPAPLSRQDYPVEHSRSYRLNAQIGAVINLLCHCTYS